jgi:glycosyltransferase involved in cell wall biosynthesis
VDLLLEAMKKVHEKHPNWRLVVAGGGKMYFDISEYEKLD